MNSEYRVYSGVRTDDLNSYNTCVTFNKNKGRFVCDQSYRKVKWKLIQPEPDTNCLYKDKRFERNELRLNILT